MTPRTRRLRRRLTGHIAVTLAALAGLWVALSGSGAVGYWLAEVW